MDHSEARPKTRSASIMVKLESRPELFMDRLVGFPRAPRMW